MPEILTTPTGRKLAYHKTDSTDKDLPSVIFMGGFMSNMEGTKATAFEQLCQARGQGYVRFDYSGHGQSSEKFIDGTISSWAEDALYIFDTLTTGPQILVGSSMGGWMALLTALQRPEHVCGIIGIAAAPDFTRDVAAQFDKTQRAELAENGVVYIPSDYGQPYPITQRFLDDGERNILLDGEIALSCPVRLVQGTEDAAVADSKPGRIKNALTSTDVTVDIIDGGDHSLSRPQDIAFLDEKIREISIA